MLRRCFTALLLASSAWACNSSDCENGQCTCHPGQSCEFECGEDSDGDGFTDSPETCHVACEGNNPSCVAECANGDCTCGEGSTCDFQCVHPPCHVGCEGSESSCAAECANGDCTCEAGSTCSFSCAAGPCHVRCMGDNPQCDGVCLNGTCTCGPGSTCTFECADGNCHHQCQEGAACMILCDGTSCGFDTCAAGDETACPEVDAVVCGRSCPPPPSDADDPAEQ